MRGWVYFTGFLSLIHICSPLHGMDVWKGSLGWAAEIDDLRVPQRLCTKKSGLFWKHMKLISWQRKFLASLFTKADHTSPICGLVHTPDLSLSDYLEWCWLSRDLYFHGSDRIIFILVIGQGTDYLALVHPSSEGAGLGLATDRKVSWASSLILTHSRVLDEASLTHTEGYSFGLEATTPH